MSAHINTRMYSPFKTVLGKIGYKYQAYCTMHKTHTMATHYGGAGCPLDRDIDFNIEETTGIDNDNESTHGSDTTVALGGPAAEGHPNDTIYSNQDKLMALMREKNDLHQWAEAREGQPAESLDCIEHKLQILSIALHPLTPPTPTEPCWEVICQYTFTLCTTQKQTNLMNSLIQDIAVFNEYDSTKPEDWLMDIETAVDLTRED